MSTVDERVTAEQAPCSDEPFTEALKDMDLFNSIRAAPPDTTGEAVAVRGDNLPWECGESPPLGQRHNDMSQTLHMHRVRQRSWNSPLYATEAESALMTTRQRPHSTPDVVNDIFNYVTDGVHTEAFGGPPLWKCTKIRALWKVLPCGRTLVSVCVAGHNAAQTRGCCGVCSI